jgi:DNA primase
VALFPQSFIDDLRAQVDLVSLIGESVPLRKMGAAWKGLCPFHQERTPSFNVNPDKGIFKCFGCGQGGDVFKFVELQNKVSFPEAVRLIAARVGMPVPDTGGAGAEDRESATERESLIGLHEQAAAFFAAQLDSPAGARARRELDTRGLTAETIRTFRYGYAPAGGRDTLSALFAANHVPVPLQLRSGLVVQREDGRIADRFRNRLMIPIARDTGAIVAFGGRALEEGQVPKYLNSPETPIYTKGRTLYGLDVTRAAVRKANYCVLVEGYFDLAQVWQAGIQAVAAICGTALTPAQVRILKRFTSKIVLSLDPDAAGQGAAARSSELLVAEGCQVNVALLPAGSDPDTFIRRSGAQAYRDRLTGSQPYLDFLLDRASAGKDMNRPDHRRAFLTQMLAVAATIPDAAVRDQFADRLAVKARITESVVRDEIKKAAAQRRTEAPMVAVAGVTRIRPHEQGLLWTLAHRPVEGLAAISQIEPEDLEGLLSASVLQLAATLSDLPPEMLPALLRERLSEGERAVFDQAARAEAPAGPPADCVEALRRDRVRRESALVQREIDRLQQDARVDDEELTRLFRRKDELARRLEDLNQGNV